MSKSNLVALATECIGAMSKYGELENMPLDALRPVRAFIIEHLRVTAGNTVDVVVQRKLAEVNRLIELREVIDDQRAEIAALKQTVDQLRQAADKKAETVRRLAANIAEYMALVDKAKELTQRIHDARRS